MAVKDGPDAGSKPDGMDKTLERMFLICPLSMTGPGTCSETSGFDGQLLFWPNVQGCQVVNGQNPLKGLT